MKRQITTLLLLLSLSSQATQCDEKLSLCKIVVEDYRKEVNILDQKIAVLEKQRNELVKQVEDKSLPAWFWVAAGVFVGSTATILLRK